MPACTIAGQTAAHRPARTALRPLFRRVCPIQRQRNAILCHNIVFILLQWATISHKKHGFQNIKGVFSHCAGAFSVGNDCVHSRTACECRKFSSVATLKVLFFRMVPCFFRFAGGIRVCSAGALFGFSEVLSRAQMGGACFSLYDIGQTGATSRPLPEYAPRSGRDTRTPCPRWKPHNVPRREE